MANINDVRANTNNPQRAYEYEVEILGSSVSGSIPILTQRVESITVPAVSVDTIEINFKSSKTMYPGRDSAPHQITVNFYDTENRTLYTFFRNWMNGIRDEVNGGGTTRDLHAAEMLIRTFAADSETVTGLNKLTNVFPTEIGDIAFDYASSDHMKFTITFAYDTNENI